MADRAGPPATPTRPLSVGLTGGLGSGKSSVARLLERRGAALLDADEVVRELYRPGGEGARRVAEAFGPEALGEDGGVDHGALARLALGGRVETLNRLIHPLVRARVARWLAGLEELPAPPPAAVVEAALLVETGSYRAYDLLVVVWCRREQQLERALVRGMARGRAEALLAAQGELAEKRRLADVVIDNSGPPGRLEAEVERVWTAILERLR